MRGRSGFALVLVLFLIVAATILGVSYVTASTVKVVSSKNFVEAGRAEYLAESGLQHALYVLAANPTALSGSSSRPLGPYRVDGSDDSYNFSALADAQTPGKYYLIAQGQAGGITRSAQYAVYYWAGNRTEMAQGLVISGTGVSLPTSAVIQGDVYNNGASMVNFARITGDVDSVGSVYDPLRRIEGQATTGVDPISMPDIQVDYYKSYDLGTISCTATQWNGTVFRSNDPLNRGGAITQSNYGGVVWLKPPHGQSQVELTNNIRFEGTFIIEGDLVLAGNNINITAQKGFPAIVATGNVIVNRNAKVTINGVVVAVGGIVPDNRRASNSRTTINGGLISQWNGYASNLRGEHLLNYESERCLLHDFSGGSSESGLNATLEILWYD